jgi:hypothetical protein
MSWRWQHTLLHPRVDVWLLQRFSSDERATGGGDSSTLISPIPSITKKIIEDSGSSRARALGIAGGD